MPIIKSAKKALRQNIKHKKRNLIRKNKLKIFVKKAKSLITKNKIKEAQEFLPQVYKILDKSAKTGVIKKNTASRRKKRITKLLNSKI